MLYLAWLPAWDTPFDAVGHAMNDDEALSGSISEREEGDVIVSAFEVTIPNQGVGGGFLGRTERYAVLSEKRFSDPQPVELCRGRVIAVPSDMGGNTITLRFQCVPPDEDDVIKAAANALRTGEVDYDPAASASARDAAEAYDPLFYPRETDDPASALAGRPEFWRWNRRTLALERVHMVDGQTNHIIGSQGVEGSLSMSLRNPPRQTTKIKLIASWTQEAKGVQTTALGDGSVRTYSYADLASSWPSPGSPVGDNTGWYLAESSVDYIDFDQVFDEFDANPLTHVNGDPNVSACKILLRAGTVFFNLRLGYDYQQQREEILEISMPAANQPTLGDDKKETIEVINLAALNIDNVTPLWSYDDPETLERMHYSVGDEVIEGGRAWTAVVDHDAQETFAAYDPESGDQIWASRSKRAAISPLSARFFDGNRGKRAMRHAVRRLHRQVLERSRALEVSFDCEWPIARDITCADSVTIEHRRILGGQATGKVSGIQLMIDGARRYARITMLVSIGDGSTAPVVGTGQEQTGDVVYKLTAPAPRVPVNAAALRVQVPQFEILNPYSIQRNAALFDPEPVETISNLPTRIELEVQPIREEDLITRRLSVVCEPIYVPQGVVIQ